MYHEGQHYAQGRRELTTHLDDLQQLLRAVDTPNAQPVKKLDYTQASISITGQNKKRGAISLPMRPEKRLKVRGIRTCGLTSMRTPLAV